MVSNSQLLIACSYQKIFAAIFLHLGYKKSTFVQHVPTGSSSYLVLGESRLTRLLTSGVKGVTRGGRAGTHRSDGLPFMKLILHMYRKKLERKNKEDIKELH